MYDVHHRAPRSQFSHGFLIHLLVMAYFTASVQAESRVLHGSSGEVCEGGKRNCLARHAECSQVNDTCVCVENTIGDGNFLCYQPGRRLMMVKNDPQVTTVTGEKFELPIMCRYLLAHFRTKFTEWPDSTCEVKVLPHHKKHRGKIFVAGIDVALRISTPYFSPPRGDISWRVTGEAMRGTYWFTEMGAHQFTTEGPWPKDGFTYLSLGAVNIWPRYDSYNNLWHLTVDSCGVDIRFRPFDTVKGKDQNLVPGVSVTVKEGAGTEWLSPEETIGLQPTGPLLEGITSGFQAVSQAMVARLLSSNVTQNQPEGSQYCSSLAESVGNCPDPSTTSEAFNTCFFILTVPKFVRCYDTTGSGDLVLRLFQGCLDAVCQKDTGQCDHIKTEVKKCPQALHSYKISKFLRRPC